MPEKAIRLDEHGGGNRIYSASRLIALRGVLVLMGFGILSLLGYAAWRGLVWCRTLRTVLPYPALMPYDVGSLRLRMTVESSHGCLGKCVSLPFLPVNIVGALPSALSESRDLLFSLQCSIFGYGDVLLWGLVEECL